MLRGRLCCLLLAAVALQERYQAAGLQCDTDEGYRAGITQDAIDAIKQSGDFFVIEGNLSYRVNISNPVGSYGTIRFPAYTFPPLFCNSSVDGTRRAPICAFSFPVGPRDAVVWLGCTPTHVKYWSVRSHTEFRFIPETRNVAAELGDPINHLTFNSTKEKEGDVWGKTGLLISTPDEETFGKVASAFVDAGLPERAVSLDIVASSLTLFRHHRTPWMKEKSDGISLIFRASEFENPEAAQEYLEYSWPVYLLRARKEFTDAPHKPLERRPLRPRGTGSSQRVTHTEGLKKLLQAVRETYEADGRTKLIKKIKLKHYVPDLDRCRTDPEYNPFEFNTSFAPNYSYVKPACGHFTRDALYTLLPGDVMIDDLVFPPNHSYVMVGVNQPVLRRAVYSNIFLTSLTYQQRIGHTANFSSTQLLGSAVPYVPKLDQAEDFFVVSLARQCEFPEDRGYLCRVVTPAEVSLVGDPVLFAERKYLEPATLIGPSANEILEPYVLVFETSQNRVFGHAVQPSATS